jgi:tetratricopeptide (TPR) repeat protein
MTTSATFPKTIATRTRRPQRVRTMGSFASALCILLVGPGGLVAQHGDHGPADQAPADEQPPLVPLYDNLGTLTRTIATSSPEAQAYFDQGLRLAYGFGHGEAVRSFREAQRLDPECASCYWGEAWALGPNINMGMPASAVPDAWAASRRALDLADRASGVEQALIRALAVRYQEEDGTVERAALDSAYADAMEAVGARFPGDLDVLALLGESHMVLRPWNYWTPEGEPQPGVERAAEVLERALAIDVGHPGSCHLYIHLVEASPSPERAEACANLLADAIPGVSHIPHMPSHIYMRVGRYGDAVRGNQRAWIADQRAAYDGTPGVYPTHNLHMLLFAGSFDGQSSVAIQAARDLGDLSVASSFYVPVILTRFGRWDEILALPMDETSDFRAGMHHFARGMARLRTGDDLRAGVELRSLEGLRERLPENARFRGHLQATLLGMAEGILAGEILASEGRFDEAVRALEEAVDLEAGLSYDEPEPWPIPVRQHLGAVLLEAGRPADAERVYRRALEVHPAHGWSLHGLAAALRAQDRDAEATRVESEFQAAWQRADVWITGSRF